MIVDFHTHRLDATAAIISVDPRRFDPHPGLYYSVGFHPWEDVTHLTGQDFDLLEQCAAHPQVVAIGETGMDRVKGGELEGQRAAFVRHLHLAHRLGMPVVVHCVRTAQDILAARRRAGLDQVPLAIHGMRGNEHVARTLLDAGCFLSFGPRFNEAALRITPHDRLLIETDDSHVSIDAVADAVAHYVGLAASEVKALASANARRFIACKHDDS